MCARTARPIENRLQVANLPHIALHKGVLAGVISDTHGLLRDEAIAALSGSDIILHAGDVGRPEILDRLREIAPVHVVRGNIDKGAWAAQLAETAVISAGPARIYMLHDVNALELDPAAAGFHIVVSGHSHQPSHTVRGGVIYLNPGSAGPRRFSLPISLARIHLDLKPWKIETVTICLASPASGQRA